MARVSLKLGHLSRGVLRHWRLPAQVSQLPDGVLVAGVGRVRRRFSAPS